MISVVIPVYNGAEFIASAIRSVLRQTLPASEIIVVDDGSADGSADVASKFGAPVKELRRPHQGGAAALNAGLAEASGDLLAFLDADDLWSEDKLALQSAVIGLDDSCDAVFGRVVQFVDMEGRISEPREIEGASGSFVGAHKIAMLIRRSSFDRIGPFAPEAVADLPEWYARAVQSGIRAQFLEQVVAFRRIHRSNTTRSHRKMLERDYLKIARTLASRTRSGIL